jgi:hypothetical protein
VCDRRKQLPSSPFRLNATLRRLFRTPVYLYRLKYGWLLGHRFLMLVQVGRLTGLRRYTILEVIEYRKGLPEMVVMSAFGRNSDWLAAQRPLIARPPRSHAELEPPQSRQ